MKVFFSFSFDKDLDSPVEGKKARGKGEFVLSPEQFVHRVSYYLRKQKDLEIFCWCKAPDKSSISEGSNTNWDEIIANELATCDKMVYFHSGTAGRIQGIERDNWNNDLSNYPQNTIIVNLTKDPKPDTGFGLTNPCIETDGNKFTDKYALNCAIDIFNQINNGQKWIPCDYLPIGYPFAYEKVIIEEFVKGKGRLLVPEKLQQGCPISWPRVKKIGNADELEEKQYNNPIPTSGIGRYRDDDEIIVDVRSKYHKCKDGNKICLVDIEEPLTLLEAGPREKLIYPFKKDSLIVGIVVSGGIAPGINAVISGICQRHKKYYDSYNKENKGNEYNLEIYLYREGFSGIIRGDSRDKKTIDQRSKFNISDLIEQSNDGGASISTSRQDALLDSNDKKDRMLKIENIITRLTTDNIDILYVIGGEGSMRAAHALWSQVEQQLENKKLENPISIVGIPKTMDNDVLWVWQTFGFLSAVEKAKEFIGDLDVEAKSNPRLCIVQLFGSDSGFVVSHAALASGVCKDALIPEVEFNLATLSQEICEKLKGDMKQIGRDTQSPNGIILLAETAIPRDVEDYIDTERCPSLQLSAEEKKAIRDFIGSPLLSINDISSWKEFCDNLKEAIKSQPDYLEKNELAQLECLINCYGLGKKGANTDLSTQKKMKELIIDFLNDLIIENKVQDVFEDKVNSNDKRTVKKEVANINEIMEYLRKLEQDIKSNPNLLLAELYSKDVIDPKKEIPQEEQSVFENLKYIIESIEQSNIDLKHKEKIVTKLYQISLYKLSSRGKAALDAIIKLVDLDGYLTRGQESWFNLMVGYCEELYLELIKLCNRFYIESKFSSIEPLNNRGARRVYGQTPDALRSGGLKVVSSVLQHDINKIESKSDYWKSFRVFVNEPRHLLRSISPSVNDIIFAQRLGILAVDNAMAGYTDFMISQWLTEYVLVPLELVVLGRKRVPQDGIFWKSVKDNLK